ncbi:Npt1/Npt2 family nucleotide transporter [Siansivirga zeaxanthinifaciens]|uniref:Membrane protein n=1 Tax=Siansivirga zeaxanthinifaciens CC-SAMT-1 TaxID=1454006 RepID=A0A0C5WDL1_9FLAO|nr:Npt1/Npt2 family nucleotide transporter [Siansivirga zeaxanthinifaciens]AJR03329.1 membrane protein [Siansivirga zeaxanthinifaciens CC-SAMT-1]
MKSNKGLKNYLLKIFDLNEHELQKTLLLQLNVFLLITTLLIVKPTINSLFLSTLTSHALPIAYILTAVFAVIGSYFYDKALEKYALNQIIEKTLIGSIISLIIFTVALNSGINLGYILFIPYIWVSIYGLLTTSQFWILTNLVYNIREAKRIFGFIGSGAIAGGIFGGYLTTILSNFIASENLFLIAAGLLIICIPITRYIWKNEVDKSSEAVSIKRESTFKEQSPIKLIKKSQLLSVIAIVVGLSVIVAKLVDYQYSHYASELISSPEELTGFFGFWFSTLSVISLVIQLFITKRIVGVFGVGNSMFWLPIGILIGSVLLLFIPELWVVVIIKIADGSLKQSVNKAATELLSIPIPIDLKKRTKPFIDVVIDSIATGIAGFILIFLINGLNISKLYVSIITVIMISVWIYFIIKLKKEYIRSFKSLLETTHHHAEKNNHKKEVPIASIVDTVKWVLENGSESQIIHMLYKTIDYHDERFFKSIKKLLNHESAKVRTLAIESLYYLKTEDLTPEIEKLLEDPNQEVTTDAFRYILNRHSENSEFYYAKYLNSNDDNLKNAALLALSLEIHSKNKLHEKFQLNKWIDQAIADWRNMSDLEIKKNKMLTILEVIGNSKMRAYYPIIKDQIQTGDVDILNCAIDNAAKTKNLEFVPFIVSLLAQKKTRQHAIDGLYKYGEPIIIYLRDKIAHDQIDLQEGVFIPHVIEKFNSQKAVKTLIFLIDHTEHAISIEALEALQRLKWSNNNLIIKERFILDKVLEECKKYQTTLSTIHSQLPLSHLEKIPTEDLSEENKARKGLLTILEHRLDRELLRIFKFLGLKYLPDEIEPIFEILKKGQDSQRANAIEFLENILDNQLKHLLIPIAETVLIDDQLTEDIIKKFNLKSYTEYECYNILLQMHDLKIKHAVLYLIMQTNNTTFIPLVEMLIDNPNETIKLQAIQTLEHLKTQL